MTLPKVEKSNNLPRAGLWMMGAVISLTSMAIAGRELSSTLSTFQILFVRSIIGLVVVGIIVLRRGIGTVKTQQPGLQIVRNIVHFSGQYCWFYGIGFLPLGLVFALEFTTPIWVAGLATLFLGEKLTPARIAAVVLGGTSLSGGRGSVGGTLVGAFVIGVLNDGLVLLGVSEFWQIVIKGIVIVVAVVVDQLASRPGTGTLPGRRR